MKTLNIPYSTDLLIASGKSPKEMEQELKFLLAVKLFELGRVSLGKAAEFCEMGRIHFMNELGRMKIPVINIEYDQIRDELSDD